MSSPMSTTEGSLASITSMAEFKAWIMFMLAMNSTPFRAHQVALPLQIARHLLEHVLEHQVRMQPRTFGHGAVRQRLLPACRDEGLDLARQRLVTFLGPLAQSDQMLLQARDGIAQGPVFLIILRAVARRIVAGGMRGRAIGHQLDERRARARARSLR